MRKTQFYMILFETIALFAGKAWASEQTAHDIINTTGILFTALMQTGKI